MRIRRSYNKRNFALPEEYDGEIELPLKDIPEILITLIKQADKTEIEYDSDEFYYVAKDCWYNIGIDSYLPSDADKNGFVLAVKTQKAGQNQKQKVIIRMYHPQQITYVYDDNEGYAFLKIMQNENTLYVTVPNEIKESFENYLTRTYLIK